ncbi:heat shock protein HslJ [Flavobacterium arsenatis]|uniref:Heat shock protein HslJ n=1 Tax=Flavobacterium arsenatis TaxID=1484332 RepID=A0ABU1TNX2_9FLAO|nr:META domain-containing protein [Flavobacterium arsenatis]MDR6967497.1 heat shock protein HslJ [Flavobacterium arsenatis]
MKKLILLLSITLGLLTSCNSKKAVVPSGSQSLEGNWELTYISGPRIAFDGLYPNEKPNITFNINENLVVGKNSCNNYSGSFKAEASKITFNESGMVSTKMFCEGAGESTYMNTLQKINGYSISEDGKTLTLLTGDVAMMRFERKYAVMN